MRKLDVVQFERSQPRAIWARSRDSPVVKCLGYVDLGNNRVLPLTVDRLHDMELRLIILKLPSSFQHWLFFNLTKLTRLNSMSLWAGTLSR